ncbi:MAG: FAD-dependent oxidoreductase [Candidatus Omnitrophica bacterium]|nr:FAD-dependent oxidoreductase [Candidatus Omnitrophota bacterium]MCM8802104.1 FAD-dependent oxidoreductase [Candidatus Omnitrophota bacterium]
MKNRKYVIVGNSIAGVSCIEGIREIDSDGEIYVFSDEEYFNYSRPLISYYLEGRLKENQLNFKEIDFYKKNRINLFLKTKCEKIDLDRKILYTTSGNFEFNYIFLGTGGKPILPKIEGIENTEKGTFTFTKLNDAKKLKKYFEEKEIKKVVILGGGLIGLKCAEGFLGKGISLTVIELSDKILPNTFDSLASEIIENKLKENNCEIIKENTIEKIISKNGILKEIVLKDGKKISLDVLVIAIGVFPNTDLIEGTKVEKNKGIIVDEYMRTNFPFVFAGGDVAETYEFEGIKTVIPIWPRASKQGKIAGINMAGGDKKYEGMFIMNSVDFIGISTISFGITNPKNEKDYEILKKVDYEKRIYRKIVIKENRIVGAIFLGDIERAGIICGLIRNKVDIHLIKKFLIDDKFGLLILPESYRKHIVKGEGIEV